VNIHQRKEVHESPVKGIPEWTPETIRATGRPGKRPAGPARFTPTRVYTGTGAGAGLIKSPELAKEIIRATKEGAGDVPVSVKTRIGYRENEVERWIPAILNEGVAALTVHFRTKNRCIFQGLNGI